MHFNPQLKLTALFTVIFFVYLSPAEAAWPKDHWTSFESCDNLRTEYEQHRCFGAVNKKRMTRFRECVQSGRTSGDCQQRLKLSIEDCDGIQSQYGQNACFRTTINNITKDPAHCDRFKNENDKYNCHCDTNHPSCPKGLGPPSVDKMRVRLEKDRESIRSPQQCYSLRDYPALWDQCFLYVSQNKNNSQFCKQIKNAQKRTDCMNNF